MVLRGVLVMALCTGGCSFIGVRSVHSAGVKGCTKTLGPPITDSVLAISGLALAIASGVSASKCSGEEPIVCGPAKLGVVTGSVLALSFGTSALYGYGVTQQCRDAPTHPPSVPQRDDVPNPYEHE
jgi:hypothetical protein